MHVMSYYFRSNLQCSCRKLQSDSKISAAHLGSVVIRSFYVKVISIISVSSDLFDLLSSESCRGPIFCTFREAALPLSSRNEVRNENTVFFEASSEICTNSSSQPCCDKTSYWPVRLCSCAGCGHVCQHGGTAPNVCVGARLCVIDGDSLQIYWSQKTLA